MIDYIVSGLDPSDGRSIAVAIRHGIVVDISDTNNEENSWLSAGFIDLQVNGFGGDDVNSDKLNPETIISLTRKLLANGVTTYLPTIITAPEEKITGALQAIVEARRSSPLVAAAIPYVHIEGPNISRSDGPRGAHPIEHVRPPSLEEFDRWQLVAGGIVRMVTLSPHFDGSAEYIAQLTAHGVYVALGHTEACAEQIRSAVTAGARLSTHLGNGCASMLPRHSNPLWPQLADDRLTATMIADMHHLPPEILSVIIRSKGVDRCVLVSDSVALAGMPSGTYDTPVGGKVRLSKDGKLTVVGTDCLAGAALPLKDGIVRMSKMTGVSLADSLKMATENPGRFVGGKGVIRIGAPADLVCFSIDNDNLTMRIDQVIVKGKPIEGDLLLGFNVQNME